MQSIRRSTDNDPSIRFIVDHFGKNIYYVEALCGINRVLTLTCGNDICSQFTRISIIKEKLTKYYLNYEDGGNILVFRMHGQYLLQPREDLMIIYPPANAELRKKIETFAGHEEISDFIKEKFGSKYFYGGDLNESDSLITLYNMLPPKKFNELKKYILNKIVPSTVNERYFYIFSQLITDELTASF